MTWAKIPNMRLDFGASLNQDCNFVDNEQVIASLEASLKVLNQIKEEREECKSLHSNSKAFLDTYLEYMLKKEEALQEAIIEEQVIRGEIERKTLLNQNYDVNYDKNLLALLKTKVSFSDKKIRKSNALMQSFQLSSTLLEDLERNPKCAASVASHIIAPSIGILGQLSGVVAAGASPFQIPLISGFVQLVSRFISYVGSINENSYVGLQNLTQSSNYYLSYKCAFKNIEKITCSLKEEEHMLGKLHLDNFAKKILKLDKTGRFKILRDLKRHSYRIFDIIKEISRLFNSPETFDSLAQVVILQSTFAKLDLEPKNPPLKNYYYIEALKKASLAGGTTPIGSWKLYDLGQIKWTTWYHRYFLNSRFLGLEVQNICKQSAQWSTNHTSCRGAGLSQATEISAFIKEVIVPALVNTLKEQRRLNILIKSFPSLESLHALLGEQDTYTGEPNYNEYSLGLLLDTFKSYSKFFLQSPLKLFAQDILQIIHTIKTLSLVKNLSPALFLKATRNTYDALAKISNNGRLGGVLYVSVLEGKVTNYFDAVSRYYLLQNQDRALKFSKFNLLADLHRKYQSRLLQAHSAGSSNLSLMTDIESTFLKVFLQPMTKHLTSIKQRYQSRTHKYEKRELLHSCALLLPFLKKEDSHFFTSSSDTQEGIYFENDDPSLDEELIGASATSSNSNTQSSVAVFCKNLLKGEEGLALLFDQAKKYPLHPKQAPAFDKACYYYHYQRAVSVESIFQKFKYLNKTIKF